MMSEGPDVFTFPSSQVTGGGAPRSCKGHREGLSLAMRELISLFAFNYFRRRTRKRTTIAAKPTPSAAVAPILPSE